MRKFQLKEIKRLFDKREIELGIEPVNDDYDLFRVIVFSSGNKYGVLETFRGGERVLKANTAIQLLKREFPGNREIKIRTCRKIRGTRGQRKTETGMVT